MRLVSAVCNVDSAKRKQLPAWIREGLEKMEREKQRQAEKDKLEQEKAEAQRAREEAEREAAEELQREQEENPTGEARVPRKSRFVSAVVVVRSPVGDHSE